ncbi:MAG: RNA polymerase sigma factor [Muribaculaceae bacterium]|nr:RNA polymerase sigma factor [Muribaculaceae bacterium]
MMVSDKDIVGIIKSDVDSGFRMLVSKYSQPIYHYVRRMVISHHDAEDVMQETFLRAFKALNSIRSANALKGWIYRIATNEALRLIDKRKAEMIPLDHILDSHTDSYINYEDVEAVQLKKAIALLPPKQQAVFNLRYYDELEYAEIALIMDTDVGNVRANYHIAKERIVKYMNSISTNYEN